MTTKLPYSPTEPLYARLKIALRQRIAAGMKPGDQLPTEASLCATYGVSRITVREAMQVLETEGVIVRRQGRGTFVAEERLREPAAYFAALKDDFGAHDTDGAGEIISCEILRADLRIAGRLGLGVGDEVYRIRSRRLNEGAPICYQVSYVPRPFLGDVTREHLAAESLYSRLERGFGETIDEAHETVDVVVADRYRACQLEVKIKTPLLLIERLVYSRSRIAVEFSRTFYNPRLVSLTFASRRIQEAEHGRRLVLRRDQGADLSVPHTPRKSPPRGPTKSRRVRVDGRKSLGDAS
jgi:GntR family transcriptional regulator